MLTNFFGHPVWRLDASSVVSVVSVQQVILLNFGKVEILFFLILPNFRKSVVLWKVLRPHPFVLLVRAACRWRLVRSIGGMVLTGENWSAGRETLYSVGGRWMNGYGALVEWYWQGKTEVLWEKHYIAWVVGEWMGMEHWWNGTDRGKLKCWERNII